MGFPGKPWGLIKPPCGSTPNAQAVQDMGIVLAWLMNEGAGFLVADAIHPKNFGAMQSTTPWVPGNFGAGLGFDGSNNKVTGPTETAIQPTAAGSILAWVNPSTSAATRTIIGWLNLANTNGGVTLVTTSPNTLKLDLSDAAGGQLASSGVNLAVGLWQQVGASWDGTNVYFYINGLLVATVGQTKTPINGIYPVIAGDDGTASRFWLGSIDHAMIFSRALHPQEWQRLYVEPFLWMTPKRQRVYSSGGAAPTMSVSPSAIPKNHSGNITLTLTGSGTAWDGTTVFNLSGVTGVTKVSQNVTSGTSATVVVTTDATHTGTLTVTETVTGSTSGTTAVATATIGVSPTSALTGATPTLTISGTNTVWTQETAAGLFSVSGGSGASIGTPTITTNTAGSAVLTVGSAAGTLTITDNSTGATTTFTASAGTIAITAPVTNQWKRAGTGSASFTVSGTYTGSPGGAIQWSSDGFASFATLDSNPSGGTYSGSISLPQSDGDYTISVRFAGDHTVVASVSGIAAVRFVVAIGGQSNEAGRGTNNQVPYQPYGQDAHKKKTASGYAALTDPTGTDGSAAGSWEPHMMTSLGDLMTHRGGLCNFAVGNTNLSQWQKGAGTGYYEALAAAVTAVGGADAIVMGPCENDAEAGTSQATYHAGIATFLASWLADFPTCKVCWRTLQPISTGLATQLQQDTINAAIVQAWGDIATLNRGADVRIVPTAPEDTVHWKTDQKVAAVGMIQAAAIYRAITTAAGTAVFLPIGCGFIKGA